MCELVGYKNDALQYQRVSLIWKKSVEYPYEFYCVVNNIRLGKDVNHKMALFLMLLDQTTFASQLYTSG